MTPPQALGIANTVYHQLQLGQKDFATNVIIDVYEQGFKAGQNTGAILPGSKNTNKERTDLDRAKAVLIVGLFWIIPCIAASYALATMSRYDEWWVVPTPGYGALSSW